MDKQKQQQDQHRQHVPTQSISLEALEDISRLLEAVFGGDGGGGGADCGEAGPSNVRPPGAYDTADGVAGDEHAVDGADYGSSDPEGAGSGSGSGNDSSDNLATIEMAKNLPDGAGHRVRTLLHMRRKKLKEKLQELQQLISIDAKMDRASLLDAAIAYVKNIQQQFMSGTCNLCRSRHMQSVDRQSVAQMPLPPMPNYAPAILHQPQPGAVPFVPTIPMRTMLPPHLQIPHFPPMLPSFTGEPFPSPTAPMATPAGESSKALDESEKPTRSTTADSEPTDI